MNNFFSLKNTQISGNQYKYQDSANELLKCGSVVATLSDIQLLFQQSKATLETRCLFSVSIQQATQNLKVMIILDIRSLTRSSMMRKCELGISVR